MVYNWSVRNQHFMKVIFTRHALDEKIKVLARFGWVISREKIENTVKNPRWQGIANKGQPTAMTLIDRRHILLVVYKREDDIIKIITLYVARRGRYGSTLR